MSIRQTLIDVSETYLAAKEEPFKQNPVADYLRHDAPDSILTALGRKDCTATGSAGQSQWTHAPWIAVFDPRVTTSAQRGYYVVYLFNSEMTSVALSLNQGVTVVLEEYENRFNDAAAELERRAALIRSRVPEFAPRFSKAPLHLNTKGDARAYEAGHAFGVEYSFSDLPAEEVLTADLRDLVRLYMSLTARGGFDTLGEITEEEEEAGAETVTERRRYRLHRKIDRDSTAAKKAKSALGHVCQACSMDFEALYGVVGRKYIEAHHLTPLSELPENEEIELNPKKDFAVLCANCHRMIHRKEAPKMVRELSELGKLDQLRSFFKSLKAIDKK